MRRMVRGLTARPRICISGRTAPPLPAARISPARPAPATRSRPRTSARRSTSSSPRAMPAGPLRRPQPRPAPCRRLRRRWSTAAPAISGTAQQGDTLSASNGSWSNSPTSYAYQWQDCTSSSSCTNINGATSSTYTLASSDVGKTIDVVVTASNAGGSASQASAQTGTVTQPSGSQPQMTGNPTNLPAVSGNAVVGDTLSVTSGTWANSPSSYSYQWEDRVGSSCSSISGATGSSYTAQASDVGHSLGVLVTATQRGRGRAPRVVGTRRRSPPTSYPNGIISEDYLLAWSPPSGCSSLNVACINSRDWSAINQSTIFNFGGDWYQQRARFRTRPRPARSAARSGPASPPPSRPRSRPGRS